MQDITDAGFMEILEKRGSPDFAIAEYFRVHEFFEPDPHILDAILRAPNRVCAQLLAGDESFAKRAVEKLLKYPAIKMLDVNLGCPAPKVYRKNVGGGLLRSPEKVASLLRAVRSVWGGIFSAKMRTGFDSDANFRELLSAVLESGVDFITVHARTVKALYKGEADYSKIALASRLAGEIPVVANGEISSAAKAAAVIARTGCAGVMCGRHAVRNPWIFRQIGDVLANREPFAPTLADVREYVGDLAENIRRQDLKFADSRLKKFLNFIGTAVDPRGEFLRTMRRARGMDALLKVCDGFLLAGANASKPYPDEPYEGLCSRPNCEI